MPRSGAPPTIGETPTTRGRRAAIASRTPRTARMGATDATGFEGHSTIASASAIASSTPGAGSASAPPYRIAFTSSIPPRSTQYSWKWTWRSPRSASTISISVGAGLSVMGRRRVRTPNRRHISDVVSVSVCPPRSHAVRRRCVARSRSPRPNHAPSAPSRRSSSVARKVSPRRPHPRSRSATPASQYMTESMSGDTCSPCTSMSSPVLTMAVTSSGGTARTSPRRNFPAPTPPASAATFMERGYVTRRRRHDEPSRGRC